MQIFVHFSILYRETTPLKGLLIPIEFFVCRSDKQMIWLGKCTPTSDLAKCVTYVIATLAKVKKRKNADSKPFRLVLCIFPLQQGIHFYNKNLEFVLFTMYKAMKSSPLLGPFCGSEFWWFSVENIQRVLALCYFWDLEKVAFAKNCISEIFILCMQ